MNIHWKTPLQIHFICSGNKELYSIFKICCTISVFSNSVIRLVVLTTERFETLLRGLTKLVPKYAGEHGQQSAVDCSSCFSIILCLLRSLLYPAKVSGLTSVCE